MTKADVEVRFREPTGRDDRVRASTVNLGWYGRRLIDVEDRFQTMSATTAEMEAASDAYHAATRAMVQRFDMSEDGREADLLSRLAPVEEIRKALSHSAPLESHLPNSGDPRYAIITRSISDVGRFMRCAASVDASVFSHPDLGVAASFLWIVGYDTALFSQDRLRHALSSRLGPQVKFFARDLEDAGSNPCAKALESLDGYWLLFLDSDDMISSDLFITIRHYINRFLYCRCIMPASIDMDEDGHLLRWRRHSGGSDRLFESEASARCLIAIRQDLYGLLGSGQEEAIELRADHIALRAALKEELLLVPDHLHYCGHAKPSWMNGDRDSQARTILRARQSFLRDLAEEHGARGTAQGGQRRRPAVSRGLCIVRTQGRNLDLLSEAVHSIWAQTLPVTACVVVHGSKDMYDDVLRWLEAPRERLLVLHAWRPDRKRGYPLNVGLDVLRDNGDRFDFFSFLDDDDILYPLFAERLADTLHLAQADVAYGLANQRRPWQAAISGHSAKPVSFLVAGNFIPIHCYVVRTSVLRKAPLRFREDLHYLEDWDFLLALLLDDVTIVHLAEVVCEYRLFGDGSIEQKRDPELYAECRDRVRALGEAVARRRGPARFWRDLADFDLVGSSDLAPDEIAHALDAAAMVFGTSDRPDD